MDDYKKALEDFVYDDKKRFVDPEKMSAVEILGLDKAKQLYDKYNGKLPWEMRTNLQRYGISMYLSGEWKRRK
jgi:uncharacterized protein YifN (PemK superfamily)